MYILFRSKDLEKYIHFVYLCGNNLLFIAMILCTFNDGCRCRQFSSEDDNFDWRSELSGISKRMRKKRSIIYTTIYCKDSYVMFKESGFLLPDGTSSFKGRSYIPNRPVSVFRSCRVDIEEDLPF